MKISLKETLKKSSPTILTCIGALGVVVTAVSAVKATPKALKIMEEERPPGLKDTIKLTWKCYIPTALFGMATISCIFGANALNKQNQASLLTAYTMLSESYKQYRNSAKTVFGDDADSKIKVQMTKGRYIHADGFSLYSPEVDPAEEILCHDLFSLRYFKTPIAAILNAQYHVNRNLSLRGYVSMNEFYDFLGLDPIPEGDRIGWSLDELMDGGYMWLDFENLYTIMDDGMECCIISALMDPNEFDRGEDE